MEDSSSRKRKNCVEDEEEEEEEECLLTGFVTKRGRLAEEEAEEADSSLLPQKTLSPDVMNKRLAFLYGAKNRRGMAIVELRLRVKQAIIPFAESLNGFAQDPTILMHLVRNASTPYTPSDLAEFLPYLVKHRDFTARSGGPENPYYRMFYGSMGESLVSLQKMAVYYGALDILDFLLEIEDMGGRREECPVHGIMPRYSLLEWALLCLDYHDFNEMESSVLKRVQACLYLVLEKRSELVLSGGKEGAEMSPLFLSTLFEFTEISEYLLDLVAFFEDEDAGINKRYPWPEMPEWMTEGGDATVFELFLMVESSEERFDQFMGLQSLDMSQHRVMEFIGAGVHPKRFLRLLARDDFDEKTSWGGQIGHSVFDSMLHRLLDEKKATATVDADVAGQLVISTINLFHNKRFSLSIGKNQDWLLTVMLNWPPIFDCLFQKFESLECDSRSAYHGNLSPLKLLVAFNLAENVKSLVSQRLGESQLWRSSDLIFTSCFPKNNRNTPEFWKILKMMTRYPTFNYNDLRRSGRWKKEEMDQLTKLLQIAASCS